MTLLDDVVSHLLGTNPTPVRTTEGNVLRHPQAPLGTRAGTLVHTDAGAPADAGAPERVVVFLGPGATFEGVARDLLPLFPAAAAGGAAPPTSAQLARALVVYAKDLLPAGSWSHHEVGLRLPLPIEIAPGNVWVVDPDRIRTLAAAFLPAWRARLRTPPTPLAVPDPSALQTQADALLAAFPGPAALGAELWTRALRNPFEVVLLLLAALGSLEAKTPAGQAVDVVLAMLEHATAPQLATLATTRAGNGILRRLASLVAKAPAGGDPARVARLALVKAQLDAALFDRGGFAVFTVAHHELPETAEQLLRAGTAEAVVGAAGDPPGGAHRLVLGRDLAVGRLAARSVAGVSYTGPELVGRAGLEAYLLADTARLEPPTAPARTGVLLTVLGSSRSANALDAVSARGPELLTAGIDRWSLTDPDGLPALLLAYKTAAPDEFDLFFALHGLEVDAPAPAVPTRGRLLKVDADGTTLTPLAPAALLAFVGGQVDARGAITLAPEWAARFRLPALVSLAYRRVQVAQALARLEKVTPKARVDELTPVPSFPIPKVLDDLTRSGSTLTFAVVSSTRTIASVKQYRGLDETGTSLALYGQALLDDGLIAPDGAAPALFVVPTPMRIVAPEDPARPGRVAGSGRLPLVVIVHGNHTAFDPVWKPSTRSVQVQGSGGTTMTVPLLDSASSVTNVPNHQGYGRLQELLAGVGIVSVSVSTNAANFFNANIEMRAQTVIAAMNHLKKLAADAASPYFGRLDLKRVGLMGHSRGGDVVVSVAKKLRGSADFTVHAVCSLSPTDFTGLATDATQLRLTPDDARFYLVVYGSLDGDVSGLGGVTAFTGTGFRHYDRATCPKAMVQLSHCCHNRFNSVWSDGTPAVPTDPLKKFQGDDGSLVASDIATLRSFEAHQRLELEYVGGLFRWQLLRDQTVRDLFLGSRLNRVGVPASLQWSFGDPPRPAEINVTDVVELDDLENAAAPTRSGVTRAFAAGSRTGFADVTAPGSTLLAGAPAALVAIREHATHPSQVLLVDATASTTASTSAVAMTLRFPAPLAAGTGPGNWHGFTYLTFRLSYTLDITSATALTTSPRPKVSVQVTDHGGRTRGLPDAAAFTLGAPSRPDLHLVRDQDSHGSATVSNATLFRFETVRVPLAELSRRGIRLDRVKELSIQLDQTVKTRVLWDSFQLVAF